MDTPTQSDPAETERPVTEDILGRELTSFRPAFRMHVARADAFWRGSTVISSEDPFFPDSQVYDAVMQLIALVKADRQQIKQIFSAILEELQDYFIQRSYMASPVRDDIRKNVLLRLAAENERWKDWFLKSEGIKGGTAAAAGGVMRAPPSDEGQS